MYSEELVQEAKEIFKSQYDKELTQKEAEEIIASMRGLAELMMEMYLKDKKIKNKIET